MYAEPHPCRPSPRLLQLRGPAASPRRAGARQAKLAVWLMQMRISSCHSCARYGRALPERGSVNPPTPSDRRVGGVARSRGDGVHFLSCHPQCWLALTKCHLNRRQATWNPPARQWKAQQCSLPRSQFLAVLAASLDGPARFLQRCFRAALHLLPAPLGSIRLGPAAGFHSGQKHRSTCTGSSTPLFVVLGGSLSRSWRSISYRGRWRCRDPAYRRPLPWHRPSLSSPKPADSGRRGP